MGYGVDDCVVDEGWEANSNVTDSAEFHVVAVGVEGKNLGSASTQTQISS